jgi:hypothetical protein
LNDAKPHRLTGIACAIVTGMHALVGVAGLLFEPLGIVFIAVFLPLYYAHCVPRCVLLKTSSTQGEASIAAIPTVTVSLSARVGFCIPNRCSDLL